MSLEALNEDRGRNHGGHRPSNLNSSILEALRADRSASTLTPPESSTSEGMGFRGLVDVFPDLAREALRRRTLLGCRFANLFA